MKKFDPDALSDVEKRAILAEYTRRQRGSTKAADKYKPLPRELQVAQTLRDSWFPEQKKFFESPATRKVGFCTRRAGKTVGSAICILVTLLENPRAMCLYICQTQGAARLYIWKELKELVTTHELPFTFNESNLTMSHARAGGILVCKGADKADEIEKLRGPKWKIAILDESASFGAFFENLVIEVIGPALRDLNGTLIMIGTAGRKKEGLFYEASTGMRKIYEVHKWSLTDNTYLPPEAKDLEFIKEEEGLTDEDPRFIREYLGRWAASDSERVFSGFSAERNVYKGKLPAGHDWKYLLGCDFGWNDECAVTVVAYSPTHPVIYTPESWSKKHAYPSDIAAVIMQYRNKYGVRRYIGDTGGYGKAIVVQLARDYGILMQAAKKQEKLNFVEFMNSEFYSGKVMVHESQTKMITQLTDVAWNDDRTDVGKHERDDLAFSFVYGWRAARHAGAGKTTPTQADGLTDLQRTARRDKLEVLSRKPESEDERQSWFERLGNQDAYRGGFGEHGFLPKGR